MNLQLALTLSARYLNIADARALARALRENETRFMIRYFLSSVPGIRPEDRLCILRNAVPPPLFFRMYHRADFARRVHGCVFLAREQRREILRGVLRGCARGLGTLDRHIDVITGAVYTVTACKWTCGVSLRLGRYVVHRDLSVTLEGVRVAVRCGGVVRVAAHRNHEELLDMFRMVLPFLESYCDVANPNHDFRGAAKARGGRPPGALRRKLRQRQLRLCERARRAARGDRHDALRHRHLPSV